MKKKNIFKYTFKYIPLYIVALALLLLCQYIISLISMFIGQALAIFNDEDNVLPSFLAQFINRNSKYEAIVSICIMFIIIAIVYVIARVCQNFARTISCQKIENTLSLKFFYHVLNLPRSYLVTHPTGDIIQRNIQDTKRYTSMINDGIWHFCVAVFAIITTFIQIYSLNKLNFVVGISVIGVVVLSGLLFSFFYIRKKEDISAKMASEVDSLTQQSFSNISMVKTFANEELEKEKFTKGVKEYEIAKYAVDRSYSNYWIIMDLISAIYTFIFILVTGIACFNGYIGIGATTSLIILNSSLVEDSSQLVGHINTILTNSISINRLNEYFKAEEDYQNDGNLTPNIKGNIEFNHVSMSYQDNPSLEILKDISFKVNEGETIGIIGRSGSGKSTLVNLLTRLDDYNEGSIIIDGVELKDISKKYLRDNMGIVNQESFVFARTIKDNLTILTKKEVNLDSYIDKVCLKEDIDKMDKGIETIVGERGVTLSGGQRQRISIARSLIKDKNILILDDSLSAIDNNVAKTIKSELKKNKCTTFIISHNLMNVMDADKILVLDKGRIIQQGNHESLIKEEGLYRDVFRLQQNIKDGDLDEE